MQNTFRYDNKHIYIYLKSIYGINTNTSFFICDYLGLNPKSKTSTLTQIELNKISYYIEQNYITKLNLKQQIKSNIRDLMKLKCYRGKRHSLGLPVRGQRTQSNAKTRKRLSPFYKKVKATITKKKKR